MVAGKGHNIQDSWISCIQRHSQETFTWRVTTLAFSRQSGTYCTVQSLWGINERRNLMVDFDFDSDSDSDFDFDSEPEAKAIERERWWSCFEGEPYWVKDPLRRGYTVGWLVGLRSTQPVAQSGLGGNGSDWLVGWILANSSLFWWRCIFLLPLPLPLLPSQSGSFLGFFRFRWFRSFHNFRELPIITRLWANDWDVSIWSMTQCGESVYYVSYLSASRFPPSLHQLIVLFESRSEPEELLLVTCNV